MKGLTTGILVLLAGNYAVQGQGYVSFGNYLALSTYIYFGYRQTPTGPYVPVGGSNTGPAPTLANYAAEVRNGNEWTVQLYGAVGSDLPSSVLSPLPGITATIANGINDKTPGTWVSSLTAEFPGAANGTIATVQLYAWYNDGGTITSYAGAVADGLPNATSYTANVVLSGPSENPAPLPEALGNFAVTPIPEPSTIALGVLGVSALLLHLRGPIFFPSKSGQRESS